MTRDDVKVGDTVTIEAMGFTTDGTVVYADYFKGDGWDIEFSNASNPKVQGGYGHWKQYFDGGQLVAINGKAVF